MKVKLVKDGKVLPDGEKGEGLTIDMKTLPHVGDHIVLADDATYEIISITHTPGTSEFAAVATLRPVKHD